MHDKIFRWTARRRTWSSPPCSRKTLTILLVANFQNASILNKKIQCKKDQMQVSHVDRERTWCSPTLFFNKSIRRTLTIPWPESKSKVPAPNPYESIPKWERGIWTWAVTKILWATQQPNTLTFRGSGWKCMVQIGTPTPSTPECQGGVPLSKVKVDRERGRT